MSCATDDVGNSDAPMAILTPFKKSRHEISASIPSCRSLDFIDADPCSDFYDLTGLCVPAAVRIRLFFPAHIGHPDFADSIFTNSQRTRPALGQYQALSLGKRLNMAVLVGHDDRAIEHVH